MHRLSTVRENSNFLCQSLARNNNNGKSWDDRNNRGSNLFGDKNSSQQQNNTISNNINPFKQFVARSSQQKATPQIGDLISSLFLPCCNMSPYSQNSTTLNPSSTIYTMPCTHGICRRCIQTILYQNNNGDNIPIQCSQCGEQYSSQEAETMFFKNGMVMEIFGKILAVKVKMDEEEGEVLINNTNEKTTGIGNKRQLMSSKSMSSLPVHKVHFSRDPEQDQHQHQNTYHHQQQTIKKPTRPISGNNITMTSSYINNSTIPNNSAINQTTSSSQNSQQAPQFNPCANVFCHNPTIGFYCSQQCQQLTINLQSVRYEIGNVIISQRMC